MAKRKTKSERLEAAKNDLRQRIADIYAGAGGRHMDNDDNWAMAVELSRIIPAVRDCFGSPHKHWYGWQAHCLHNWETVKKATEFLFGAGFRADEEWLSEAEKEKANV